ncbi:MAG TPA: hypothetical protein VFA26_16845, partial [Gemmataceae bacterium]|nr:hypothetical protein [Gemmataceae bacterium]
ELRVTLEETLALAGPRNRFGVFVAVPTLTACLFLDEPGLRKLFGAELTTERLIRSRFEPDKVLDELLSATGRPPLNNAAIVGLVGSLDKSRLQQFPAIRSLVQFIESAVRAVPA